MNNLARLPLSIEEYRRLRIGWTTRRNFAIRHDQLYLTMEQTLTEMDEYFGDESLLSARMWSLMLVARMEGGGFMGGLRKYGEPLDDLLIEIHHLTKLNKGELHKLDNHTLLVLMVYATCILTHTTIAKEAEEIIIDRTRLPATAAGSIYVLADNV